MRFGKSAVVRGRRYMGAVYLLFSEVPPFKHATNAEMVDQHPQSFAIYCCHGDGPTTTMVTMAHRMDPEDSPRHRRKGP